MRWIGRILIILVLALILVTTVAMMSKNRVLRSQVEKYVEQLTEFPLDLGSFRIHLLGSRLEMDNFLLRNPAGFELPTALEVEKVEADPRLIPLLLGRPEFRTMVIDIPQLNIITRKDGVNNFELLRENVGRNLPDRPSGRKPDDEESEEPRESMPLQIDRLEIRLGQARVVDYSQNPEQPKELIIDLEVDRVYEDVDDLRTVTSDLLAGIMQRTLLSALQGDVMESIFESLSDGDPEAKEELREKAGELEDRLKGLFQRLE